MQRLAHNIVDIAGNAVILLMAAFLLFSACKPAKGKEADKLNDAAYSYHYRDLKATQTLAERALRLSADYDDGYAEACNHLAFVAIARMKYKEARGWLDRVDQHTDNEIELLVADVQQMLICQRTASNKDFYTYREQAMRRLRRIGEEATSMPPRLRRRAAYARSEFNLVSATYYYYVSMEKSMLAALADISPDELEQDTAQYLHYLHSCGTLGAVQKTTVNSVRQTEFDYLAQCYMLAGGTSPYPYWQAAALQAISEHLQQPDARNFLIKNNLPAIHYLNVDQMADSLLAGNLAQRAQNIFTAYGDVYHIASAYRTLGECYWAIHDYASAEDCYNRALTDNRLISQSPYMIASIREQLSLLYSAVDDKQRSDFNRNIYLDLQEQARQDRQLEARASLLDTNATQLNWMIAAVLAMILLIVALLYILDRLRKRKSRHNSVAKLLEPLQQWRADNVKAVGSMEERQEELEEDLETVRMHLAENRRRNLEQRAKLSLVGSITPFIDRMMNEIERLSHSTETEDVRAERLKYISELTDKINQYNDILTQWIQMRQGKLSLKIESFGVQQLFDLVAKGKMSYQMKGIDLQIEPTRAVVKADRTLTLFMINTIADNARKFTPPGGTITIEAIEEAGMIEIAITDTGCGMSADQQARLFDHTYTGGHGFGLLNCKGIIEKYKKTSCLFAQCNISVSSQQGRGSRLAFRLPKGIVRQAVLALIAATSSLCPHTAAASTADSLSTTADSLSTTIEKENMHHKHSDQESPTSTHLVMADRYADSVYFCNIKGEYRRALHFADSARQCLNRHYLQLYPKGKDLMEQIPKGRTAAEIKWLQDGVETNYNIILDIRNESAVAALALHQWTLYHANNDAYTRLFRDLSADSTLPDYVLTMQTSENSKTVAVIILVLLLLTIFPIYYLAYFRHVLSYRFAVDKINEINHLLLSPLTDLEKLARIGSLWDSRERLRGLNTRLDTVVGQIEEALRQSIDFSSRKAADIETIEDDLHRAEYENAQLHIANSVLDNCLSTLKHETMYYPSRIRQLIDTTPDDINSLRELADYYKSLYTMLSAQAMEQVEQSCKISPAIVANLFDILTTEGGLKAAGGETPRQQPTSAPDKYARYEIRMPSLHLSEEQRTQLFTPLTVNLKYLLCRQIVRDLGEATNLRGCGIQAVRSKADDCIVVEITIPKKFCKGLYGKELEQ